MVVPDIHTLLKSGGRPAFIYGTAWKKEETTRLVQEAVAAGFTAVDTAAQPRHYREDLLGEGLRKSYADGIVLRDQLYIQTKFTSPAGQDAENMPYDPSSPLEVQVRTSLESSFNNLRSSPDPSSASTTYLDCLVMHSPLRTNELTVQAWKILESYVPSRIKHLGISNVDFPTLEFLYENAQVKPMVVQNRFYPKTRYDAAIRRFCSEKGIIYQSFWTLTGNPHLLANAESVAGIAELVGVSRQVALYSLVLGLGIAVLNGTTNSTRMKSDLDDVARVQTWAQANAGTWSASIEAFEKEIGGL